MMIGYRDAAAGMATLMCLWSVACDVTVRANAGALQFTAVDANGASTTRPEMMTARCEGDIEITISPGSREGFREVPRAIGAIKEAGFGRMRVLFRRHARPVDVEVTVVTAGDLRDRDLNELLRQGPGRCLVWIHADWSNESAAATPQLLGDAAIWEELSQAKMRLVFIDITDPTEEAYSKLREVFEAPSRVPVAIVHVRHRHSVTKMVVGPIVVTRRGLVEAIRKASNGEEQGRESRSTDANCVRDNHMSHRCVAVEKRRRRRLRCDLHRRY